MFSGVSTLSAQESFQLIAHPAVGRESEVIVQMNVTGSLQVLEDNNPTSIPLSVDADLRYRELRQATDNSTQSTIRQYAKTQATITVDGNPIQPQLRDSRRRIRVEAGADVDLYSLDGALTREELDLLEIQGNTVLLNRLLPTTDVVLGDSWKHHDALLASFLAIDAVSVNEVRSTLASADSSSATIELSGRVEGAVHGVSTEIEVGGKYLFDRQQQTVTKCQLLIKEQRSIGHVGPGIKADSTINILIVPQTAREMANLLSVGMNSMAKRETNLEHTSPSGFTFNYDRRWHVMSETDGQVSLRMVNRGDLVAQANVSLLQSDAGPIDAPSFRRQITQALGERAKNITSEGALKTQAGQKVAGITAVGIVSGLPIEWRYYLIGDKAGQQVAVVVTLEPDLSETLNHADRAIVESFRWTR
ncbi:MAG: hypothetical protein MPJ50_11755 [Pirellulales bacterium]|nr:hypothetical protein [Pirellulales bacterium]